MTKLVGTFRRLANSPKIAVIQLCWRGSGMSVAWRLPTLTREWFLAGTYRSAKRVLPLPIVPLPIPASVWKQVATCTTCTVFVIKMVSLWNVIFYRLWHADAVHVDYTVSFSFFFSFSLSYRMFMSHCFHCPLFFPISFWLLICPVISVYLWFTSTTFIIVYFAKYYWVNQTKEVEMSSTCSSHGREGKPSLAGKVRVNKRLGGPDRVIIQEWLKRLRKGKSGMDSSGPG